MMKHVLLADDDPSIRTLAGYVLRREGYRIYEAHRQSTHERPGGTAGR